MANNNVFLKVLAKLNRAKSKTQLQNDLDQLQDLKVEVTPELSSRSRQRLQHDLDTVTGLSVDVEAELDRNRSQENIERTLDNLPIDIQVTADLDQEATMRRLQERFGDLNFENGLNFGNGSNDLINRFHLLSRAWDLSEDAARRLINTSTELDEKLTDLRMVTGDNYSDAYNLVADYNSLAKELGSTTSEVLEASSEWLRQGKTPDETTALIEQSMILSKVGAIDSSSATKRLTSALNGYKLAASDASKVVDKLTTLDLAAAVSSDELSEALSRTASSASLAGVSLDKILSYITVVEETTQKSASTIGESFKSIFSRMGKVTNGEAVDDMGEDISQVESVLRSLGIELRESESEFRNFDAVLDDVGNRWKDFSGVQQRQIASAFAGVYQSENFLALMNNYEKVAGYVDIAANSAGTAAQKFEAYQDSIAAHANSMKAAFESLSMDTLDADVIKNVLDIGTGVLTLTENLGLLKTALAAIGTVGAVQGITALTSALQNAYNRTAALTEAMRILSAAESGGVLADDLTRLQQLSNGLSAAQMELLVSSQVLTNEQRIAILTANGLTNAQAQQTLSTLGLTVSEGGATAATFSFAGAMEALNLAIAANPIGALLTVLVGGITVISTIASVTRHAAEEAEAALSGLSTEVQELQRSNSSIAELSERYEILARNTVRTAEEQEEFASVQNRLKELLPELNGYYDEQGNFILAESQSLESLTKTYQEYLQAKRQELADAYVSKIDSETAAYQKQADEIARLTEYIKLYRMIENGEYTKGYESDELQALGYSGELGAPQFMADYGFQYGTAIEAQKQLNQLQTEQAEILNDLRTGTVNLLAAQDEWYNLTAAQQNGIRSALSTSDYAAVKSLYDSLTASGADYSSILSELVWDHRELIAGIEETSEAADNTADALSGATDELEGFADALTDAESVAKVIHDAQEELAESHNLTADTVSGLIEKYPELESALASYLAGVTSESELQSKLKSAYDSSVRAYQDAIRAKIEDDEDFYTSSVLNNSNLVKKFAENYGIDLTNYGSLTELKTELDEVLQKNLAFLTADNIKEKAKQYGVDLDNFKSVEEQKLAVAKAMAAARVKTEGIYAGYSAAGLETELKDLRRRNSDGRHDSQIAELENYLSTSKAIDYDAIIAEINGITASFSAKMPSVGSASSKGSSGSSASDALKKATDEALAVMEHQIYIWEQKGGFEDAIIGQYRKMQALVHATADKYRAQGLSDTSEEIRELQKKWWEYADDIKDVQESIYNDRKDMLENSIYLLEQYYAETEDKKDYSGMQAYLHQQAELYSQIMSLAQSGIEDLLAAGAKTSSSVIADLEKQYYEAAENIKKVNRSIADNLIAVYDDFISKADDFDWWGELGTTKIDYLYDKLDSLNDLYEQGLYTYKEYTELVQNTQKDIYDEQKDSLQDILDMVEAIIRQEAEDAVDAYEKQKDIVRDMVDLKKQSLRLTERERSYNKNVTELTAEIAKKQARLQQLKLDDSRESKAEQTALLEEIAKLQAELAELQNDHSLELQEEALDKEYDNFADNIDKEIDLVQDGLENAAQIHQKVIDYINDHWSTLYDDLNQYDIEHGSGIVDNIKGAWDTAYESLVTYKDALGSLTVEEAAKTGIDMGETTPSFGSIFTNERQRDIVGQMYSNSKSAQNYFKANGSKSSLWTTDAYLKSLNQNNYQLRDELQKLTGKLVTFDSKTGKWYMDGKELFAQFGYYHGGGTVGEKGIKDNELLCLLEKGEDVLTEEHQQKAVDLIKNGAFQLLDSEELEKFQRGAAIFQVLLRNGDFVPSSAYNSLSAYDARALAESLSRASSNNYSTQNNQEATVHFSPTYNIQGTNIKDDKELLRKISNETCNSVIKAFRKAGLQGGSLALRPS